MSLETENSDDVPAAPTPIPPSPELIAWAMNSITDEEIIAGIREIRATGGYTFEDLVRGLSPEAISEQKGSES